MTLFLPLWNCTQPYKESVCPHESRHITNPSGASVGVGTSHCGYCIRVGASSCCGQCGEALLRCAAARVGFIFQL